MSPELNVVAGLAGGYLLGAIPGSWLIARYVWGVDLRKVGSGNPGATNALRALGPKAGIPALGFDMAKGSAAVWLASRLAPVPASLDPAAFLMLCGMLAVLGHTFPIFLGFKGGKGVATGAGVMLMMAPVCVGLSLVIFGVTVAITRYVSLGSILAAGSFPILVMGLMDPGQTLLRMVAFLMGGFIVFRHRTNIRRLLEGTESKLGQKPAEAPQPEPVTHEAPGH